VSGEAGGGLYCPDSADEEAEPRPADPATAILAGIPASALAAAEVAIRNYGILHGETPAILARAALEAAAPLLAEAWGVTERERQSEQLYAEHARAMRELKEDGWTAATGQDGGS
jgi:hypothetical protein